MGRFLIQSFQRRFHEHHKRSTKTNHPIQMEGAAREVQTREKEEGLGSRDYKIANEKELVNRQEVIRKKGSYGGRGVRFDKEEAVYRIIR